MAVVEDDARESAHRTVDRAGFTNTIILPEEEDQKTMYVKQFYTPGLAHCSYLIGGNTQCIIVDPDRYVDQYIEAAKGYNLKITAIIETHLHADFVSGHLELAALTGAPIYMSEKAQAGFPHVALKDQEEFVVDTLRIEMFSTPGHTPEGSIFTVADLERGPESCLALTGDTLLVGDVGRPDLFPDLKEQLARHLFVSLKQIMPMGDHVEVYPAHGMGSLCGRALSAKLQSTIGVERLHNYALAIDTEEEFSRMLLDGMPEAPDHFSRCSETNRLGPTLLSELGEARALKVQAFLEQRTSGAVVVDTRDQLGFAAAHVPCAYSLPLQGNYATFSGWILPPDQPVLLILERPQDLASAVAGLRRVGIDRIAGYLEGGMTTWANAGLQTNSVESISVIELKRRLDETDLLLLDTRLASEWEDGHIAAALHAVAPDVRHRYEEWDPQKPVALICNSGNRSVVAASLLKQRGFEHVVNVIGGTQAWQAAGFPLV